MGVSEGACIDHGSARRVTRCAFLPTLGDSYDYFIHPYNMTWRNERAVEIAICKEFVAHQNGRGMEFGNVLAHYGAAGGRSR